MASDDDLRLSLQPFLMERMEHVARRAKQRQRVQFAALLVSAVVGLAVSMLVLAPDKIEALIGLKIASAVIERVLTLSLSLWSALLGYWFGNVGANEVALDKEAQSAELQYYLDALNARQEAVELNYAARLRVSENPEEAHIRLKVLEDVLKRLREESDEIKGLLGSTANQKKAE